VSLLPWLAIALVAIAYLRTLCPYALPGDPSEFIVASVTLGVCHPTGYPLYVVLGKIATSVLPFVDSTWLINFMSLVYALLALIVIRDCLRRIGISPITTAVCLLLLGLTPSIWDNFTLAEVYGLQALLFSLIVRQMLFYEQAPSLANLGLLFFIAGCAMGNHMTIVLAFPGLAAWLFLVLRRSGQGLRWRGLAISIAFFALGSCIILLLVLFDREDTYNYLTQYAFEHPEAQLDTKLARLSWLLSGSQFQVSSGMSNQVLALGRFGNALKELALIAADNGALLVLGVGGMVLMARRGRRPTLSSAFSLFLWLTLLCNILFFSTYLRFFEPVFFVQGYVVLLLGMSIGLDALSPRRISSWAVHLALVSFCTWTVKAEYERIDKSDLDSFQVAARNIVTAVEPSSVVFAEWDISTLLWHQTYVKGRNRGVRIVNAEPKNWLRLARQFRDRPRYYAAVDMETSQLVLKRF
jgi:hypothetical protein